MKRIRIFTVGRFGYWWALMRQWLTWRFDDIKSVVGALVPATEDEYELFKIQLSDKIDDILTPIIEDNSNAE